MRAPANIVSRIGKQKKGIVLDIGLDGMAFQIGALRIIASWEGGWDHVSVSVANRLPKYSEMSLIKDLCFRETEWAIEYHAPKSDHINIHPNCLHLWRPQNEVLPTPPSEYV